MAPTFLTPLFGYLCLVLVSENEIEFTRASVLGCPCNSGTVADFPTRDSHNSVPAVAEKLDTLLKFGREVPWMIQQRLLTKPSMYFFTDRSREIWTRCCHFHGTIHLHVRFSVSHKTFFLLLEKTECKLYEHKWSTSNKLNQNRISLENTGSRFPWKAGKFLKEYMALHQRRFILHSHHC
jgi:hypothetical protein